jgi:hypothetical protein
MAILEVTKAAMDSKISEDQFQRLSKFSTASWAIWSPGFNDKGCNEDKDAYGINGAKSYIWSRRKELKNNIILLGLNPSGNPLKARDEEPRIFGNFHTIGHRADRLLKETISDGNLSNISGAFMTDLSNTVNGNSDEVEINSREAKEIFEAQLQILKPKIMEKESELKVICWSDKAFYTVLKEIYPSYNKPVIQKRQENGVIFETKEYSYKTKDFSFTFYWSLHYSFIVNGWGNDRKEEFKKNLEYINKQILC